MSELAVPALFCSVAKIFRVDEGGAAVAHLKTPFKIPTALPLNARPSSTSSIPSTCFSFYHPT